MSSENISGKIDIIDIPADTDIIDITADTDAIRIERERRDLENSNITIYASYASSILIVLAPLFIVLLSSSNKIEGLFKAIIGIICLILFPSLYVGLQERQGHYKSGGGIFGPVHFSSAFSVIFPIVMTIMFLTNR